MFEGREIQKIISGHHARNASLRSVFLEKKVDLGQLWPIDCHFWTSSEEDAIDLGAVLKAQGFEILRQNPASSPTNSGRWNLETRVRQSIELTMRDEFTEHIAKIADAHKGVYDGWGTTV